MRSGLETVKFTTEAAVSFLSVVFAVETISAAAFLPVSIFSALISYVRVVLSPTGSTPIIAVVSFSESFVVLVSHLVNLPLSTSNFTSTSLIASLPVLVTTVVRVTVSPSLYISLSAVVTIDKPGFITVTVEETLSEAFSFVVTSAVFLMTFITSTLAGVLYSSCTL